MVTCNPGETQLRASNQVIRVESNSRERVNLDAVAANLDTARIRCDYRREYVEVCATRLASIYADAFCRSCSAKQVRYIDDRGEAEE